MFFPEGNGTVLDNTLVVWGSEIGKGNNHSFNNVPLVLAGGALKPGRYLQVPAPFTTACWFQYANSWA